MVHNAYPAIQCVQHRMSSPVSNAAGPVSLSALTKVQTLSTKCSLVDFAVVHTAEWHANVLHLKSNNNSKMSLNKSG